MISLRSITLCITHPRDKRMHKSNFFAVAIILCALFGVIEAQIREHYGGTLTRDHILANYGRRREQLKKIIEETKEKVSSHEEGRNLLEEDEYARLQKNIGLFEKKLERMSEPMDDKDLDRMVERENMRAERRRHREL